MRLHRSRRVALGALWVLIVTAAAPGLFAKDRLFPDVLDARVRAATGETFDFDVTVSSPYDTPKRYANGFRVATRQGEVLGERELLHDHQDEQPFTRDLHAVPIPRHVTHVVVQARDQINGYGGRSLDIALPGR